MSSLYDKIREILDANKDEFKKVMRYRGNGWVVPIEKEKELKNIVRERDSTFSTKDYGDFQIQRDKQSFSILMDGKVYKDVPYTGNIYDHMITQDIFLKKYMIYDLEWGYITEREYDDILTLNLRHDQPEAVTGDTTVYAKTSSDYDDEHALCHRMIDDLSINTEQKKELHRIQLLQENRSALFKLYERLKFIEDIVIVYQHLPYLNNGLHACFDDLFQAMKKIKDTIELPSWVMIEGIKLPSTQAVLKDYADHINHTIPVLKDYLPHLPAKDRENYERTLNTWHELSIL